MIKLSRSRVPSDLTADVVAQLTQEFENSKRAVWNRDSIKTALKESSANKCAYCESRLTGSVYMEVEHFEDKDRNPGRVLDWENLLPSCKRCNAAKGTHDVVEDPIINPYEVSPGFHLRFKLYRFVGSTDLGRETIQTVNLNDATRLVTQRFQVGERVQESIEMACERYAGYMENQTTNRRNRLLNTLEQLLLMCQPEAEWSATAASVVQSSDLYKELRQMVIHRGLWNDSLEALHNVSFTTRLLVR